MLLSELAGRRVVVWGYGREGRAAVGALSDVPLGDLSVIDDNCPADADRPVLTGTAADAALAAADVVIKSPGVSRYDERVLALTERGAVVTGGSALWMAEHHARTVAVTGSKGKSTTSSLIHHLATAIGIENTYGGNIGVPLLELPAAEQYVVELSSYQCSELTDSPAIAVLTSLFPEHLNWHGSAERYYADKLNLVAHGPGRVIVNATDERLLTTVRELHPGVELVEVGAPHDAALDALSLPGAHNRQNAHLAVTAVRALAERRGVDLTQRGAEITEALRRFQGLPHRLAVIADEDGLRFVDDSLSTAPQAAIAALGAFPDGPLALIVGGQDRGVDYTPLHDHLAEVTREITVIGIPDSGARILDTVGHLPHVTTALADDLTDAVRRARAALRDTGGTVLLSPAAPSYGIYRDHRERGAAFASAVAATRP